MNPGWDRSHREMRPISCDDVFIGYNILKIKEFLNKRIWSQVYEIDLIGRWDRSPYGPCLEKEIIWIIEMIYPKNNFKVLRSISYGQRIDPYLTERLGTIMVELRTCRSLSTLSQIDLIGRWDRSLFDRIDSKNT